MVDELVSSELENEERANEGGDAVGNDITVGHLSETGEMLTERVEKAFKDRDRIDTEV